MKPLIRIAYCPKCGWMLRAAYMAQELLTSFTDDIRGVLLEPSDLSGKYTIYIDEQPIFDRKETGHFPEIRELKQVVRNKVSPGRGET